MKLNLLGRNLFRNGYQLKKRLGNNQLTGREPAVGRILSVHILASCHRAQTAELPLACSSWVRQIALLGEIIKKISIPVMKDKNWGSVNHSYQSKSLRKKGAFFPFQRYYYYTFCTGFLYKSYMKVQFGRKFLTTIYKRMGTNLAAPMIIVL